MTFSITITDTPSVDGATQTRTIGVTVRAPNLRGPFDATVALAVDATQNGEYRALDETRTILSNDEQKTVTIETFVGVNSPYDLRAAVELVDGSGKSFVESTTATVTEPTPDAERRAIAQAAEGNPSLASPDVLASKNITPRVGDVEPLTMGISTDLPFDVDSNQTACGQTIRTVNGDKDWRVVFEGVVNLKQARALNRLRLRANEVTTRTALFGETVVDFDTLSFERTSEEAVGDVGNTSGPIYKFQVQSKQDTQSESETNPLEGDSIEANPNNP